MKKIESKVLLFWIAVIILCCIILTFSITSDNDILAIGFPFAILFGIVGYGAIKTTISTAKGRKRIKELRSNVPQIEVKQENPPFPVYSFDAAFGILFIGVGCFISLLTPVLTYYLNMKTAMYALGILGGICILYGIYACIKKIRTKALSFYQDDPSISLYEKDAVKGYINSFKSSLNNMDSNAKTIDFFPMERLRHYLSNDYESFLSKKCEHIKFQNETEFWSCYAEHTDHTNAGDGYSYTIKTNYIFAMTPYKSETRFRILICSNEKYYLNETGLYIPKYSNLPPFVVWGEEVEKNCEKIESICSDFATKTRATFVIEIMNGKIYIGLKHARFGKHFHIFNKERANEQTRQAIEELTDYLLKIKAIIE